MVDPLLNISIYTWLSLITYKQKTIILALCSHIPIKLLRDFFIDEINTFKIFYYFLMSIEFVLMTPLWYYTYIGYWQANHLNNS